jgi:hypothetical protein
MNQQLRPTEVVQPRAQQPTFADPRLRLALLVGWALVLCFVPNPRPLGAPEWIVHAVCALTGIAEPAGRVIATFVLRAGGLALLGALVLFVAGTQRWNRRSAAAVVLAPVLATATLWVNLGYFPIAVQLLLAALSAALGAVAGLALARNRVAALVFVLVTGGLFAWGTATGISDDEDAATRAAARHLLTAAPDVPDGDAGFARMLELAFDFAAESSRGVDPVAPNRAALLALAVILGDEHVARVAGRAIDPTRVPEAAALRKRVTLYGRNDWPRHFFLSVGLTLLADGDRSITVGLTKELMDATPGGSGFSFGDLAADAAGDRFARAATRDADAAHAMQARLRAGAVIGDYFPDVRDLPEKLSAEAFQERFGGLGGDAARQVVADIERRLAGCAALR